MLGGDLKDEVLAQLRQPAKQQFVLLGGQIVVVLIGQCGVAAQPPPPLTWIGVAQDSEEAVAMVGQEVEIPLHPAQGGRDKPRLRKVRQCAFDCGDLVQRVPRRLTLARARPGRAVVLDNADVGQLEDAGGRIHEVDVGVVQAAHRRPLLAQHIRIVAQIERHGGQFAQRDGMIAERRSTVA